jgi:hypothetical protein
MLIFAKRCQGSVTGGNRLARLLAAFRQFVLLLLLCSRAICVAASKEHRQPKNSGSQRTAAAEVFEQF